MISNCCYYIINTVGVFYYDCHDNLLFCEDIPIKNVNLSKSLGKIVSIQDTKSIYARLDFNAKLPRPHIIEINYDTQLGETVNFYNSRNQRISYFPYKYNSDNEPNIEHIANKFSDKIDSEWVIQNRQEIEFRVIPRHNCIII